MQASGVPEQSRSLLIQEGDPRVSFARRANKWLVDRSCEGWLPDACEPPALTAARARWPPPANTQTYRSAQR